ncbi:hypothetical protein ACF3MZ_21580 [Paenibacillaceae bacterium WGS1546]|uniref:hypothetical protein n=1 Tax=Cohnella sp. WGS1546 TaxID=3366810 RepID=UPI00372D7C0F
MKKISAILLAVMLVFSVASVASANGGLEIVSPVKNSTISSPPLSIGFTKPAIVSHYNVGVYQLSGGNARYTSGALAAPPIGGDYTLFHSLPSSFTSQMTPGTYYIYLEGYYSGGYYSDSGYFYLV